MKCILNTILLCIFSNIVFSQSYSMVNLNGHWEWGYKRDYRFRTKVPGLITDPTKQNKDSIWLRRFVQLPRGTWDNAFIELKGARFNPSIYINGTKVISSTGGMAPIKKNIEHIDIRPGNIVMIEISLAPLEKVSKNDASRIPDADLWRSNVSSCIWDDILLYLYSGAAIKTIIFQSEIVKDSAFISYELVPSLKNPCRSTNLRYSLKDRSGVTLINEKVSIGQNRGIVGFPLKGKLQTWSFEHPNLYELEVELFENDRICDKRVLPIGHKDFKVVGKQFELNGRPVKLRAASVVWHRWLRDPAVKNLGWDNTWFEENIVLRLKKAGANTLRFHLGLPPDSFLKLCDEYGLMVQSEWSFFHGMNASSQSLMEQWPEWFNASLKHPSVVLMHGWNETDDEQQLTIAFDAINKVAAMYRPVVIGHRDVIHVHKYWWSLFENLGLYYDSYQQFDKPVMADEFGGNYLDEYANVGKYPTNESAFLRFLGRNASSEERLKHQALANGRVAEYWRNIGVAGFSPFCALGAPEDGNTWFLGPIREGHPKPVWKALSAAYAARSLSLDMWNRHFLPATSITIPISAFNESELDEAINGKLSIVDSSGSAVLAYEVSVSCSPYTKGSVDVTLVTPAKPGTYTFLLETFDNSKISVTKNVCSTWEFDVIDPSPDSKLLNLKYGINPGSREICNMFSELGLQAVDIKGESDYDVAVIDAKDLDVAGGFLEKMQNFLSGGGTLLVLNAGPKYLGEGYRPNTGSLQEPPVLKAARSEYLLLPFKMKALFLEQAEPESHIQFSNTDSSLWKRLKKHHGWLWNGYRGGLIVPASDLQIEGLNKASFLDIWKSRGAADSLIGREPYFAYHLAGFYGFSKRDNDSLAMKNLRQKVKFLVEDAPALKDRINPDVDIDCVDLTSEYIKTANNSQYTITRLVTAGKDLVRNPVQEINLKESQGKIIISQLLMEGRLSKKNKIQKDISVPYYDPAAVQFLLNMLDRLVSD